MLIDEVLKLVGGFRKLLRGALLLQVLVDLWLHLFEGLCFGGFDRRQFDDVPAKVCLHRSCDLSHFLHREHGILERLDHRAVLGEKAKVAPLLSGTRIL